MIKFSGFPRGHLHFVLKLLRPAEKCCTANRTTSRWMSSFKVRLVSKEEDDLKNQFLKLMATERLRPGSDDVNSLLAEDPTGLFVGELDGKPVGFVSYLKYDQSYSHGGTLTVKKEYRGKRYTIDLCKATLKSVSPSRNITGYTVSDDIADMMRKFGFQSHCAVPRYDVHLHTAFQNLSQLPPSDLYQAQTIDRIDKQKLLNYDASVFGYQRIRLLQTLLQARGSHSRVAINKEGAIVGYAHARISFIKEEGYRLGPFYADTLEIAQVLLKALFEDMLKMRMSPSYSILFDVPEGANVEAKKLAELLDGKFLFNLTFLSTKGVPKGRFEKWFAINANLG